MMTIKEVLAKYHEVEIDLLLAFVLRKSKEFLFMNPEYKISKKQYDNLTKLIKRRLKGEPIAYILGYKDFYGLRFKVNRSVLIPRSETEKLVSLSVRACLELLDSAWLRSKNKIKILDVGTGSGNIIISLAHKLEAIGYKPKVKFYGSDISKRALQTAKENARHHKVKIKFIHSNILENIRMTFDVIIANLPYVTNRNYELGIKNLEYEPKAALTDGTNQWKIYQEFLKQLPHHLSSSFIIFLEIDPKAKKYLLRSQTKSVLRGLPQRKVKFYSDLNKLWRYCEISSLNLSKLCCP